MSEGLILRRATPADASAVASIWNPIIRDTAITFWPTERSDAEIAAIIAERTISHTFLIAEIGEKAVGFATYKQFRDGGGYARSMEHTVYIADSAKGLGAGRTLLRAIESHAQSAGHRLMIGAITGDNDASIRFHERMGYTHCGMIPQAGWKFGKYHDLVLMSLNLTE